MLTKDSVFRLRPRVSGAVNKARTVRELGFIPQPASICGMQKAEPRESDDIVEVMLNVPMEERMKKARSAEYFEAWKKVAEKRVHLVFGLLAIYGSTIPEGKKRMSQTWFAGLRGWLRVTTWTWGKRRPPPS